MYPSHNGFGAGPHRIDQPGKTAKEGRALLRGGHLQQFVKRGPGTKGPVAFLIWALTWLVYFISKKGKFRLKLSEITGFFLTLIIIGGTWFLILIINGHFNVIVDFIEYQVGLFSKASAKHVGFFGYHFVVLFFGVFPASIFAINSFKRHPGDNPAQADFRKWMLYLFWVVLILFSIVKSKIVHYSSLCYFPLTFLCAHYLYHLLEKRTYIRKWNITALVAIAIVAGIVIIVLPFTDNFKTVLIDSGLIKHGFTLGNLEADGQWTGFESLIGILLVVGIIAGTRYLKRKPAWGITCIFFTVIVFTYTAYIFVAPGIERYTQNAAIEYYKKLESKDTYVATLGYKSYAHLFYSKFKPQQHKSYLSKDWLGNGNIDKPAYFSIKIHKRDKYTQRYPKLECSDKKNGFVFCKREPW